LLSADIALKAGKFTNSTDTNNDNYRTRGWYADEAHL